MRAFKGFNADLTCTMGNGSFQYVVGKTYEEASAKCAREGFHCVEEPIDVFSWYRNEKSRYCMVEADGDINEVEDKICCTKMTIVKELTVEQLAMYECVWISEHPDRANSTYVKKEKGEVSTRGILIVRGKHPKGKGKIGDTVFLLREKKGSKEIECINAFRIDGNEYMPDRYYRVDSKGVLK